MLAACASLPISLFAQDNIYSEQEWGLAAVFRTADVIYDNSLDETSVSTFIPMLFYKGEYGYVDGIEGGLYLYDNEDSPFTLSAVARMRFIDIPAEYQNDIGGDTGDIGLLLDYDVDENWTLSLDWMIDRESTWHSNLVAQGEYAWGDFILSPKVGMRYKSSSFNSLYYGLEPLDVTVDGINYTGESAGSGIDYNVGLQASYHVASNLYLLAGLEFQFLDSAVKDVSFINESTQTEYYLGFGFFNNKDVPLKKELDNKAYWRIAHGWGTPSSLGDIIKFDVEKDPYNSQLTTLFYGHPLTDNLFGLPLDIYITPGLGYHWSHEKQASSPEYVLAIKAYYTFNWPFQWRFGVAEGLSYVTNVTYLEEYDFTERKDYENTSNLLNYLDFSFDVNLGDLFNSGDLNDVWLGYTIHHRSAIFEKSSQYGRLKGGSNYNMVYLQYHF
jgi:outer membrane protein